MKRIWSLLGDLLNDLLGGLLDALLDVLDVLDDLDDLPASKWLGGSINWKISKATVMTLGITLERNSVNMVIEWAPNE